ncbi:collagen alpha-1(XVII) chain-like [Mustela lutreola]|uniref:collagen alpha-1(XVII) chain-like n=1 Tax=Mustela lutreola TaxID=9666 RepID=UPI002797ACEA|nr:collagen alpha-1(XVII) chain-like [Mustela lutreola]
MDESRGAGGSAGSLRTAPSSSPATCDSVRLGAGGLLAAHLHHGQLLGPGLLPPLAAHAASPGQKATMDRSLERPPLPRSNYTPRGRPGGGLPGQPSVRSLDWDSRPHPPGESSLPRREMFMSKYSTSLGSGPSPCAPSTR